MKSCSVLRESRERRKGRGKRWGESETVKERARNPKFTLKEAVLRSLTSPGRGLNSDSLFFLLEESLVVSVKTNFFFFLVPIWVPRNALRRYPFRKGPFCFKGGVWE